MLPSAQSHIAGESKGSRWDKARLSLVMPIGVIVAVAIVCVVVAVLTSANAPTRFRSTANSVDQAAVIVKGARACARSKASPRHRTRRPNFATASIRNGRTATSANGCKPSTTRRRGDRRRRRSDQIFAVPLARRRRRRRPARRSRRASICCAAGLTPCRTTPLRSSPGRIRAKPGRSTALIQRFLDRPAIVAAVAVGSDDRSRRRQRPRADRVLRQIYRRRNAREDRRAPATHRSARDRRSGAAGRRARHRTRRRARRRDRALRLEADAAGRRDRRQRAAVHRGGARRLRAAGRPR